MEETDFKYDVFISYSHKDEEWVVNALLRALENAGLRVCIDFRDFDAGKIARHNMRDACKESAYTVLVMTSSWVASEWTTLEGLFSYLHDPIGKRQRTIPILLDNCEIPEDIEIFTYIDFVRKDREAIAWKQLFKALNRSNAPNVSKRFQEVDLKNGEGWFLAHPYGISPNFTGRYAERNMLTGWLNEDKEHPLLVLRALGGFGKSALAWYWLTHDVDAKRWPKVVWWSFYEGDANFENFLAGALRYTKGIRPEQISRHQKTEMILDLMKHPGTLLVMDGFERALRAFGNISAVYQGNDQETEGISSQDNSRDCISPYADIFLRSLASSNNENIRGKVLITTRLTPRAVEHDYQILDGCLQVELGSLNRVDAVSFFRARGVRGPGFEIEDVCAAYGYHPLSLRLLTGLIMSSPDNSRDIAIARKIDITDNIIQNKHHVLEHAYNSLARTQKALLGTIACFRSSIDDKALQFVFGKTNSFDEDIQILIGRGLLHYAEKTKVYDLHPIVRRYAYDRLTHGECISTHERIANYFETIPKAEKVEKLEDIESLIEIYHHTVRAGKLDEAVKFYHSRLADQIYYRFGAFQTEIELLSSLLSNKKVETSRSLDQEVLIWLYNSLATSYSLNGQPRRAIQFMELANTLDQKRGNKEGIIVGLGNLAQDQLLIGSLRQADGNLNKKISLCQKPEQEYQLAVGHQELGYLLIYLCQLDKAEVELNKALAYFKYHDQIRMQSVTQIYIALLCRQKNRTWSHSKNYSSPIVYAQQALELVEKQANVFVSNEYDFIRAHWILGSVFCIEGQLTLGERHLSEALARSRAINNIESEANILLDLARLRYNQEHYEEAKSLAEEALLITERCGYVLQGADVNLFLAQYVLEQEKDKAKAMEHAETALNLAYCDGPPYYYKVAYHEAERLLERLKAEG